MEFQLEGKVSIRFKINHEMAVLLSAESGGLTNENNKHDGSSAQNTASISADVFCLLKKEYINKVNQIGCFKIKSQGWPIIIYFGKAGC